MSVEVKSLLFLALIFYFADMKQKLNAISTFLLNTDWDANFTTTFTDVCRRFKVDPVAVDDLLYDIFGMSGDEIIEQYRRGPMMINCKIFKV